MQVDDREYTCVGVFQGRGCEYYDYRSGRKEISLVVFNPIFIALLLPFPRWKRYRLKLHCDRPPARVQMVRE